MIREGYHGLILPMLGRLRRTTRLDVGLALSFSGISYLVWTLVAGTSRAMVQAIDYAESLTEMPVFTSVVNTFFVERGVIVDVAGLAWLVVSLLLVVYAGRQRLSISWAWLSAIMQAFVAALGGVAVGWAMNLPYMQIITTSNSAARADDLSRLSQVSLPVMLTLAIVIWVTCVVLLLVERAHFKSRGPTLRDGMKSNVFR